MLEYANDTRLQQSRPVLTLPDEPVPIFSPAVHALFHPLLRHEFPDESQQGVLVFRDEIRRKERENRLERGAWGGEKVCLSILASVEMILTSKRPEDSNRRDDHDVSPFQPQRVP